MSPLAHLTICFTSRRRIRYRHKLQELLMRRLHGALSKPLKVLPVYAAVSMVRSARIFMAVKLYPSPPPPHARLSFTRQGLPLLGDGQRPILVSLSGEVPPLGAPLLLPLAPQLPIMLQLRHLLGAQAAVGGEGGSCTLLLLAAGGKPLGEGASLQLLGAEEGTCLQLRRVALLGGSEV